ncbi:MAG: prolipoprotein diacylglyceryl transferase [Clostridia bacterium]|nr:prolipoprotein diacylglyceryl transferase [Clostridia bacterium]
MLLAKNLISFPGLGIGEFSLDNVAFTFGESFSVYWYGIIITCGIIFAYLYAVYRGKYESVCFDDTIDIVIWTVILGVIGARLYYVLTSLDKYIDGTFLGTLKNMLNLRGGGLAIYGGIIGGILGIVISTRFKKINTIKVFDMAAPGVMIGQLLGRWGNFFNGEAFGGIVSEKNPLYFMRMGIISRNSISDFGTTEMVYVHPTFLYESLWNLTGFIIINALYKKKKFNGQIACMYLSWYGFGRMFIEGLRTDSLYLGNTGIRISQLVGLICFVVFGALLVVGLIYSKKFDGDESKLTAFDKILVPSLIQNPVFFAKKAAVAEGAEQTVETVEVEAEDAVIEQTEDEAEIESDGENSNIEDSEKEIENGEDN